jgi:hypothetical protein
MMVRRRDPLESAIESALQPGHFIAWNQESAFVAGLEEVERSASALTDSDPLRATLLYEVFIAACYLKADEIHSEWEFGNFVGELANGWIRARQASGADCSDTARTLLSWIDRDDYGFFNDLGSDAPKVLDQDGLTAFEKEVHDRFEIALGTENDIVDSRSCELWARTLRAIYAKQGDVEKYIAVAERTGLTPGDCAAVARILEGKRKPDAALIWIEQGIAMVDTRRFYSGDGHDLAGMRRALLKKLGRSSEALESAWADFEKCPGVFDYEELMLYVPKPDRAIWHEKALASAERGNLGPFIDMCVKTKELDRLAKHLECTGDRKLEDLSHYVTEPAAAALAKAHSAAAAKVFRSLCMRTLKTAKSKYYDAALAHLRDARRCYLAAGLEQQWEALALEIRRNHSRKSSFMPGFNAIITGKSVRVEPSFLDRARWRWASKDKS